MRIKLENEGKREKLLFSTYLPLLCELLNGERSERGICDTLLYMFMVMLCGAWVLNPGSPDMSSWREGSPLPTEPYGDPPHLGFFCDISQIIIFEIGHLA